MTDGQKRRMVNNLQKLLRNKYQIKRSFKHGWQKIPLNKERLDAIGQKIDAIYKSLGKYLWQNGTYQRGLHGELKTK